MSNNNLLISYRAYFLVVLFIGIELMVPGLIIGTVNTIFFLYFMLFFLANCLSDRILNLKIITGMLLLFYGLFLWRYNVYFQVSELSIYYAPLLSIEATWNPISYGGMPLFFQVANFLMRVTGLSEEAIIIYIRLFLLAFSTLSIRSLYISIFGQDGTVKIKSLNAGAHLAGIFLILDFSLSFLTLGDQLKQMLGVPFYIYAVQSLIERRKILFTLLSAFSILCHHLYIPLIILTITLKLVSDWKIFKSYYVLVIVPAIVLFSVVMIQHTMSDINYWGDKINHSVPTGLLDGFLLRPGAILATLYYLFFILLFLVYAKRTPSIPNLHFISLMMITLFMVSKVNIVGISFAEPARFYSMLAPFLAIAVTRVYLNLADSVKKLLILTLVISYNILPMQIGAKTQNYFLTTILMSPSEIVSITFNQDYKAMALIFLTFLIYSIYKISLHILTGNRKPKKF